MNSELKVAGRETETAAGKRHKSGAKRWLFFFPTARMPGSACGAPRGPRILVEECDVRHLARRGLGVHPDSMPFVQRDRRVIAMTHSAAHEDACIANAMLPLPALRLRNFR